MDSVATTASFHLIRSLTNVAACYAHRTWKGSTSMFGNIDIVFFLFEFLVGRL